MDNITRVEHFWRDLEVWLKQTAPHWLETLPPPVSEEKIKALELHLVNLKNAYYDAPNDVLWSSREEFGHQ